MIKRIYFSCITVALTVFAFTLTSCEEETTSDENKAYVGEWETNVYPSVTGAMEKMYVTLTNTTFEDVVYQGASAEAIGFATAVKGDITFVEDGKIDVDITAVKVGSESGSYVEKASDETQFYAFFNGGIGQIMLESFTATYEVIDESSMRLIIPVTYGTDTLNLTK